MTANIERDIRTKFKTVKLHAEPTLVLVSSRIDESVFQSLDPEHRRMASVQDEGMEVDDI